jgi:hypothetical protein
MTLDTPGWESWLVSSLGMTFLMSCRVPRLMRADEVQRVFEKKAGVLRPELISGASPKVVAPQ